MNVTTKRLLAVGAIILLGLYAASNVTKAWSAAGRLELDRYDLRELQQKLRDIDQVSSVPRVAALELEASDRIVNRLNDACKQAGISNDLLSNQTPFQPQRIGQSDFKLRRVEIKLKAATIAQIVAFCDALKDESTGSVVRDLQLYEPQRSGRTESWKSQMTLTQVIFSPKSET